MPNKIKKFIKRITPKAVWGYFVNKINQFDIMSTYHRVKKTYKRPSPDCNGKIKIVFIVQRTEVFPSVKSIFEAALKNDDFEVYLLALPRCKNDRYELIMDTLDSAYQFCLNQKGGKAICSYDSETNSFFDLEALAPDYVFLNVPYTFQYPKPYHIDNLSRYSKVCFVPYGYAFGNAKLYPAVYSSGLHHNVLQKGSFIFVDSRASYKFCRRKTRYSELLDGKRVFEFGYPRFDNVSIESITSDKPTALWIPRWTTPDQEGQFSTSFFKFKDSIINTSDDYNIIIRPHPLAFENYIHSGVMSREEVEAFKTSVNEKDNLTLDQAGDYHIAFDSSDVLIADFSSIIAEYFMTGKPVIYCSDRTEISPDLKFMADTFYYAQGWDEVKALLDRLNRGDDPLKEKREEASKKFLSGCSKSGERILEFLQEDFNKTFRRK